jgi:hypothetical protein
VICRLHAKDPAGRYQSAAEVAEVLGQQLAECQRPGAHRARRAPEAPAAGPPALPAPVVKKPSGLDSDWQVPKFNPRSGRSHRVRLTLLGLAAAAVFAVFALWPREEKPVRIITAPTASQPSGNVIIVTSDQDDHPAVVGSGTPATQRFDFTDFTGIDFGNTFQATITKADHFEVSVTADDNVLPHVRVDKDGSRLRVRLEGRRTYRLRPNTLKLSVSLPVLEAMLISGASRATIAGFASDRPFHVRIGGASRLEGSIQSGNADFEISGASTVKLGGSARDARVQLSGSSTMEATDFAVRGERLTINADGASTARLHGKAKAAVLQGSGASRLQLSDLALDAADVELSGASDAKIQVKELLSYELSSASRLEYYGEPTIKKSVKTGASSVSHR